VLESFDDFEMVGTSPMSPSLALCAAYSPDVVITDLLMPLMDGINVTRLILDKFPHIDYRLKPVR